MTASRTPTNRASASSPTIDNPDIEDQDSRVSCDTPEEAERVAHICAAYRQPCELVVCEAYHRVLHRELIHASADQAAHALGLVMLAADRA
jgi:hypothetical protein